MLPKSLSGMTTPTTASDDRRHPTKGSNHVTCLKIHRRFVVITSVASLTASNAHSSPSRRTRVDRRLALVMPTGKTGWFVVKGQTVERLVVVGRTKASNSSGSWAIVLYVVVPGTVLLIVRSVVACRP